MSSAILRAGVACMALLLTFAQAKAQGKNGLEVYGSAQVDYIQDFNRTNPTWQDTLRPSKLPTTVGGEGSDGQSIFSIRQSRLGVRGSFPVQGQLLITKLEFDFFGSGASEGQIAPNLRDAYGQWGEWLGGRTYTLFMDADVFPNVIDYWGPSGMVYVRNPQIRWTPVHTDSQSFSIALEKPSDDIDPGKIRLIDPDRVANAQTDEKAPDLTAQVRQSGTWGHVQLAGLVRQVGFETKTTANHEPSARKTGWGLDLTGALGVGTSGKFLFGIVTGQGIASYMNDGGTDMGPEGTLADISAKLIPLTAFHVYYDHSWNDRWTSSVGYSQNQVDNSSLQTDDAFKRGQYCSVNLLTTPFKNFLTGAEYLYGARENKNGSSTHDNRIQVSMKYSFSSFDF